MFITLIGYYRPDTYVNNMNWSATTVFVIKYLQSCEKYKLLCRAGINIINN